MSCYDVVQQESCEDGASATAVTVGRALGPVRNEMLAVLNELRFITQKMKSDDESTGEINDWKFASMVIDRACFFIFTVYFVFCTARHLSQVTQRHLLPSPDGRP
jgi:hypothetical protein